MYAATILPLDKKISAFRLAHFYAFNRIRDLHANIVRFSIYVN
jgi:hypothetical protein